MADLKTKENALSVWHIEDDQGNLDRVLAAIALTGDHVQKLDYILFDRRHVDESGLQVSPNPGATHDSHANANWHLDLTHLSAGGLSRLANTMFAYGATNRRFEKDLVPILRDSVSQGFINGSDLHLSLASKLQNK